MGEPAGRAARLAPAVVRGRAGGGHGRRAVAPATDRPACVAGHALADRVPGRGCGAAAGGLGLPDVARRVGPDSLQGRLDRALPAGRERRGPAEAGRRGRLELGPARRLPDLDRHRPEPRHGRLRADGAARRSPRLSRAARRDVRGHPGVPVVGPARRAARHAAGRHRARLLLRGRLFRTAGIERRHQLARRRLLRRSWRWAAATPRAAANGGAGRCCSSA